MTLVSYLYIYMQIYSRKLNNEYLTKIFYKKNYYSKDNDANDRFNNIMFRNVIFKGMKEQETNFKTQDNEGLNNKNISTIRYDESTYDKKYINYINIMRQLDNEKNKGLNYFDLNLEAYKNKGQNSKIIKLFKKEDKDEVKLSHTRDTIRTNILEERSNNIKFRKISSKLLEPHYFFTARYNQKSMPTQIKHWTSSIYSYVNSEKVGNNFLDLYTSKLISLFFSVKYVNRKLVWNKKLIEGFKILPNSSLIKDINTVINYTSRRSGLLLRNTKVFNPIIFTWDWVKKQIKYSFKFGRVIKQRKADFLTGYYPKKKAYVRKLNKIMLSKPLFKHTSFNLLIDLFVYNNKRYKFRMLNNISLRRSIYKYMYSMYVNTYEKVKETINRPRFFYINIIEPSRYTYYRWVIYYYELLLIKKKNSLFIYVCLLILQLNYEKKNKLNLLKNKILNYRSPFDQIGKSIWKLDSSNKGSNNDTETRFLTKEEGEKSKSFTTNRESTKIILYSNSFKRLKRRLIKFNLLKGNNNFLIYKLRRKRDIYNNNKLLLKDSLTDLELEDNKKIKKNIKERKSVILSYKKYIQDFNNRINSLMELGNLSLLNNTDLKDKYKRPSWLDKEEEKKKELRKKKRKMRKLKQRFDLKTEKEKRRQMYEDIMKSRDSFKKKMNKIWTLNKKRTKKMMKALNVSAAEVMVNTEHESKLQNQYGNKIKNNIQIRSSSPTSLPSFSKNIEDNKKLSNIISIETSNNKLSSQGPGLDKDKYIREIFTNISSGKNKEKKVNNYKDNDNIKKPININTLFTSFYINKNNSKENLLDNENNNNKLFNYEFTIPNKKSVKSILDIKMKIRNDNTRVLWDKVDYSILNLLYNYFNINITGMKIKSKEIKPILDDINKFKGFGNIWYIFYFLGVIKKEFFNINKEVLISKDYQVLPYSNNVFNKSYNLDGEMANVNEIEYSNNIKGEKFKIKFWSGYSLNKRDFNLGSKLGINLNLFKPYYRYLIPYFIFKSYLNLFTGKKISKLGLSTNNNLLSSINGIKDNKFIVFNFLTVKILLDLLHYNYRSLLRVKPKYYYINKLRLFKTKFKKLNINNWIASIRFIRKLRKTPLNYWLRYHRAASYYFNRVVENAELDTKRKIFVPFVIYFEDILYNIYGKWVILRLWPLKRYYLSSYILAGRVLSLILWRKKRQGKRINFQKITSKLITGIRILQIKKAYDYYIANNTRWPIDLINKMKDSEKYKHLNYNTLEYFNTREDSMHNLNTYILANDTLSSYLPAVKDNYLIAINENRDLIKNWRLKDKVVKYDINNLQFIYYWLRPLKNYILKLNRSFDISGIKMRIKGRAGVRRNNLRSTYKTRFYGSFLGPTHSTIKLLRGKSIPTPRLRGYLKSNIDYAYSVSKSTNGAISFKVWMSSVISTDMHELLLHLVHIKLLYDQLINRYYTVDPYLKVFKYNQLLLPKIKIDNKKSMIKNNRKNYLKK